MSKKTDYSQIHIETSLPKPWEEETTFNDILYDWMGRAPWLAISLAAHLLVFFILAAIPWSLLYGDDSTEIQAQIEQVPEDIFEEPEEPEEEIIEEEIIEEPVLQDAEVTEETEDVFESLDADTDFASDTPFDSDAFNDVIGIGGGAGGKMGGRFGRGKGKAGGGKGIEKAIAAGLQWLADHQDEDGSWDADNFMKHDPPGQECDGAGRAQHDVGVTGLALLAFLGEGNTTDRGQYKDNVARGIKWLRDQQDPDTGLLGDQSSHEFLYNHGIATLAVCEAYYFSKSPLLKRTAQEAIFFIQRARNPYGAWRYDVPPIGDNDTSVTGWMVFALKSAQEAGLEVDEGAFEGALSFIDEVTDTATGHVGYSAFGEVSSRIPGVNDHYPPEKGEAMTAVGLLCRIFLQQDPKEHDVMDKHAELLQRKLPEWDPDGFGCDMYYWYYGTYAMYQMGAHKQSYWSKWEGAMKDAIIQPQRTDGSYTGSWDPIGPWGFAGGRVYSTAIMTLCAEVYFRYSQVLGSR